MRWQIFRRRKYLVQHLAFVWKVTWQFSRNSSKWKYFKYEGQGGGGGGRGGMGVWGKGREETVLLYQGTYIIGYLSLGWLKILYIFELCSAPEPYRELYLVWASLILCWTEGVAHHPPRLKINWEKNVWNQASPPQSNVNSAVTIAHTLPCLLVTPPQWQITRNSHASLEQCCTG